MNGNSKMTNNYFLLEHNNPTPTTNKTYLNIVPKNFTGTTPKQSYIFKKCSKISPTSNYGFSSTHFHSTSEKQAGRKAQENFIQFRLNSLNKRIFLCSKKPRVFLIFQNNYQKTKNL